VIDVGNGPRSLICSPKQIALLETFADEPFPALGRDSSSYTHPVTRAKSISSDTAPSQGLEAIGVRDVSA